MTRGALVAATCLIAVLGASPAEQTPPAALTPPALSPELTRTLDPVIDALWLGFSRRTAIQHVRFVSQFWRLPGNAGYEATLNRVHTRLVESGFQDKTTSAALSTSSTWFETYPTSGKGWNYSIGTLAIVRRGQPDEIVLSRAGQRLALCINSFSTPSAGVTAPLVDVGAGDKDEDYAGKDLTGAVVLGDATEGQLWRRAVTAHGAIGVVSTSMGGYVNPDRPGAPATPRDQWNILQWGSVPYDEARKGFGFKATPHAAAMLRARLKEAASNPAPGAKATVRVTIASTFSSKPTRTLVAEIPGRTAPDERIVVAAHVQEPGANDNASGVATLTELARALRLAIRSGRIAQPDRTITFLWLDEVAGSRQWLKDHPVEAKNVRYMFSMDMTGEDVTRTGGSFLIERWPDPGAVWDRPWDPHTEWGRGTVRASQLKGDLLNDVHLAICERVARKTSWSVKTNPYEGGSDHTVFGGAGIPAVLDWHFTDRYYHTNLDTADKTSPSEMRNVGVSVAASAWLLASSSEKTTLAAADIVAAAGRARVALETREGAKLAAGDADPAAAEARETAIVDAWRKWYGEAVQSASRLIVGKPSPQFAAKLDALAAPFAAGPGASFRVPGLAASSATTPAVVTIGLRESFRENRLRLVRETTPGVVLLAIDRLMVDRQYPTASVPAARHADDLQTLQDGLASTSAAVRRIAVRGLGRFEVPGDVPKIVPFLGDPDAGVRTEAAAAIAQAVTRSRGADVLPALQALENHQTSCESRARLRFDRVTAARVVNDVSGLAASAPAPDETLSAAAASCVALVLRQNQGLAIDDRLRGALRNTARSVRAVDRASLDAFESLGYANDDDKAIVAWATDYHCPGVADAACGWEMRYLGATRSSALDEVLRPSLERARHDAMFQVRLAALRKFAAAIAQTKTCAPILDSFADTTATILVRLEAASLLDARCDEHGAIVASLRPVVADLADAGRNAQWQLPARALEALARVSPADAAPLVKTAFASRVWQVRVAAARAATTGKDEAALLAMAGETLPNVRTEILDGLVKLKSPAVSATAIRALDSRDFQLLRSAAIALKGTADRDASRPALLRALDVLTREGKDTSRDPRQAILDRLKEIGAPAAAVQPYLHDFDPQIASAAADVLATITGTRPDPAPAYRAPVQPTEAALRALPAKATLVLASGDEIGLDLLADEAPIAVARFVALANAGYYNGLTFHRVEPLFVIQGGSPGASEYMGDARYWRDEIGLEHHTRGAVGLSTRGRDSVDGQIFIDLTDWPRLNYIYTIFARVSPLPVQTGPGPRVRRGMDAADHVVEGTVITEVVVGR